MVLRIVTKKVTPVDSSASDLHDEFTNKVSLKRQKTPNINTTQSKQTDADILLGLCSVIDKTRHQRCTET